MARCSAPKYEVSGLVVCDKVTVIKRMVCERFGAK